jgi:predicted MPP superfamily phosphohydrolase
MGLRATTTKLLTAAAVGGVAVTTYALREARQYTLRRIDLPVLPLGVAPVSVLQISDLHLVPGQQRKRAWVHALGELEPDLVIDSGDNLAHPDAVPAVLDCFAPLLERPGVFVHGSNDYYAPGFRNPFGYLFPDNGKRKTAHPLPWRELTAGFTDAGWIDLLRDYIGGLPRSTIESTLTGFSSHFSFSSIKAESFFRLSTSTRAFGSRFQSAFLR